MCFVEELAAWGLIGAAGFGAAERSTTQAESINAVKNCGDLHQLRIPFEAGRTRKLFLVRSIHPPKTSASPSPRAAARGFSFLNTGTPGSPSAPVPRIRIP